LFKFANFAEQANDWAMWTDEASATY